MTTTHSTVTIIDERGRKLRYVIKPGPRRGQIVTVQEEIDGAWDDVPGWRNNGMAGVWRLNCVWRAYEGLNAPQWDPAERFLGVAHGVEV